MDGITDSMDMSKLWEIAKDRKACPGVLQFKGSQRVKHNLPTEQQATSGSTSPRE